MNIPELSSLGIHASELSLGVSSARSSNGGAAFARLVEDLFAREGAASANAAEAMRSLATGKAESMHAVTLAVAEADLNFRLILEIRNRLTEAYQEVMRMQL